MESSPHLLLGIALIQMLEQVDKSSLLGILP